YLDGVIHFNAGRYFEAHEIWEEIWLRSSGEEKLFYQMLIQSAVGLYHFERNNWSGARGMHRRVTEKLAALPRLYMSLDLADFERQFNTLLKPLIEEGLEAPQPQVARPALELSGEPWAANSIMKMSEQRDKRVMMDSRPAEEGGRLATALEEAIGQENVTRFPDRKIEGLGRALLVRPGTRSETAQCLQICSRSGAHVIPAGLMTWLECGNPVRSADVVLSFSRMNRVVDYSPADLTIW